MTFREAIDKRLSKVRLPHWADSRAHLEIHRIDAGDTVPDAIGPWVTLHDCGTETPILWVDLLKGTEDRYVEYKEVG